MTPGEKNNYKAGKTLQSFVRTFTNKTQQRSTCAGTRHSPKRLQRWKTPVNPESARSWEKSHVDCCQLRLCLSKDQQAPLMVTSWIFPQRCPLCPLLTSHGLKTSIKAMDSIRSKFRFPSLTESSSAPWSHHLSLFRTSVSSPVTHLHMGDGAWRGGNNFPRITLPVGSSAGNTRRVFSGWHCPHTITRFLSTADFWTPLQFLWALGRRWCLDDQGHLGLLELLLNPPPWLMRKCWGETGNLYLTLTSLECLLKVKKKANFPWPGKVRLRMQGHPSLKSTFLFLLPSNKVDIFIMSNSTRSGSVERCKKTPVWWDTHVVVSTARGTNAKLSERLSTHLACSAYILCSVSQSSKKKKSQMIIHSPQWSHVWAILFL